MHCDRCDPGMKNLSTRSLPSTLLKKSEGRNFAPYQDRVIPPPVAELALIYQRRDDEHSIDVSSVSTQSTPYSQDYRDLPSREPRKERIRDIPSKLQPDYTVKYKSRRMRGENKNTHRRQPSPENHRPIKPSTAKNIGNGSRSQRNTSEGELPKNFVDKISENLDSIKDEEMHLSLQNIVSRIKNDSMVEESSSSSSQSLSSREREIKSAAASTRSQKSKTVDDTSHAASASRNSDASPAPIIPNTSSLDALASTYTEEDDRLIIPVSTSMASKTTTKARGSGPAKDSFRRMDSLIERSSSIENSISRSSGDDSHSSMNVWENTNESTESKPSKQRNFNFNDDINGKLLPVAEESETKTSDSSRESAGSSPRIPQRSNPRREVEIDCKYNSASEAISKERGTSINKVYPEERELDVFREARNFVGPELQQDDRQPFIPESRMIVSSKFKHEDSSRNSESRQLDVAKIQHDKISRSPHPVSPTHPSTTDALGDTASNPQSASVARSKAKDTLGKLVSLRSRENDILSAAASRKSGQHSSSHFSREVLIEEHEKPVKHISGSTASKANSSAWKKIDSALFSDDQSELKLFHSPVNDIAFDDFLTTTSSCSSISVSHDPSGYIVNTLSQNARPRPVAPVRSTIQFDRVKSVLDRMRAPVSAYPNYIAGINPRNRVGMPVYVASKPLPNFSTRPMASRNFPQRTMHGHPKKQREPTGDDVASARGVPVVAAASFHGDWQEASRTPPHRVEFQATTRLEPVSEVVTMSPRKASEDPPANTFYNA